METPTRSHHCFPLKSSGVSPAGGGALQKMTGWRTSVYSCLLCCLCSFFPTISTCVQHIHIYVLSMVYCVAGRGFTREVQSLRGEIMGAEEREATMLAQYVKFFFHSVCLQVFLLLLWSTKLIGLQGVHLHFFPSYLPTLKYCHNQ